MKSWIDSIASRRAASNWLAEEKAGLISPELPPDSDSTAHRHCPESTTCANDRHTSNGPRISITYYVITILNFALFAFTLATLIYSHFNVLAVKNYALKKVSAYSPVLDAVDIPMHLKKMGGTFFPGENSGIGRLEPGPSTDERFEDFEKIRTFVLTRDQVIKLGKDPERVARFPDDYWGFGPDAYMGQLDIFHQIHCLNELRLKAFEDYYGPLENQTTRSELWWIHMRHCTDMLLQNIMCHADTEIITVEWTEKHPAPVPDFSVNRQCRDFDALIKYRDEHAVSWDKFVHMKKPEDVKDVPVEAGYWTIFGPTGDNTHHPDPPT